MFNLIDFVTGRAGIHVQSLVSLFRGALIKQLSSLDFQKNCWYMYKLKNKKIHPVHGISYSKNGVVHGLNHTLITVKWWQLYYHYQELSLMSELLYVVG